MWKTLPATFGLIGLNALLFLASHVLLPEGNFLLERLPMFFIRNDHFGIWQLISHMFMHADFGHLFLNMFGLFSFGAVLERIWGARRFLIFYFAAGIGAALIYTAVNTVEFNAAVSAMEQTGANPEQIDWVIQQEDPERFIMGMLMLKPDQDQTKAMEEAFDLYRTYYVPMVGASGAIYGILTAFGMLFPNAKLRLIFFPVPVAAKYFIPVLLLLDLFSGVTGFSIFGGGIAHFAHLGGALIGFLLILLWREDLPQVRLVSPMME